MTEAVQQPEFLETLKAFNNAIVTIRLYPPKAPQITNAVERGYKAIKQHLRQYGDFTVGLVESEPILCGDRVPLAVLQAISNLIVYRQLALLGVEQLAIRPGLDRTSFRQVLSLFTAKVEEIKQEGGGRAYITRLRLDRFFPETVRTEPQAPAPPVTEKPKQAVDTSLPVRREFVEMLLGKGQRHVQARELREVMNDPQSGGRVLAAGIRYVLQDIQKKRQLSLAPAFILFLENSNDTITADQKEAVAAAAASLLLRNFNYKALSLLLCQEFPADIGTALFSSLLQQMSLELFGQVVGELREKLAQLRLTATPDSLPVQFISQAIARLQQTAKGKQYLGQEKARSIIDAGEKARQAKRVQAGVQALLQGNHSALRSEELTAHLPFALQKLIVEEREDEATALLRLLASQAMEAAPELKVHIIRSLALIGENLVVEQRWDWLESILEPLLFWMEYADDADFVYEKTVFVLQALMTHCWETSSFALGDRILSVFYQIRAGSLVKSSPVRIMVGRAQDRGIDRAVLPMLLEQCLASPTDDTLSRRLILQGPIVSRFLVEALMRADSAQDRIKIIDLLTYGEQFLPPILVEKLAEPMPWYGKRNLLKLMAEAGSSEHLDSVYPFLQHEDLRVQREAFICIYKISGSQRKAALLRALADAGETMKLQVVRALVPFCDAEVAEGLGQLLRDREYFSPEVRDTLMANVCLALGRCPFPEAIETLQQLLQLRGKRGGKKISDKVWKAAEQALNQIFEEQQGAKKRKVQASQLRKSAMQKAVVKVKKTVASERKSITGLTEEKEIQDMLQRGESVQAKSNLLELIAKTARFRRFTQAEQLREWLIKIDSMALSEIIRAAEIIEEEKQAAVDKGHLEVWSDLYDVLTTEEFSILYHALHHKRYANEETIVKKGSSQTSLFFINSGRVKLFYHDRGGDVLVKTMGRGEVLGAGTFFDASVWTISVSCLGTVDISSLKLEKMQQWKEEFPALESKLNDFCRKFEGVDEFFRNSNKDRRRFERHNIAGRVATTLLDNKGQSTGINSRGDLFDISAGGISFFVRISKKENARLLLGRSLKLMLPIEGTSGHPIIFEGVIMAVRAHHAMESEYSVHVEFKEQLERSELQRVQQLFST